MSNYTTQLRFICESLAGYDESKGYEDIETIIERAVGKIFDFDFPIFDEGYRAELCRKIILHYYTHEIGSETYALWKLRLKSKMLEIMPYYNKMYKSMAIEVDPTKNMNYTRTNTETGHSESDNWTTYQNTPQGGLQGVREETYLTDATHNDNSGDSSLDVNETLVGSNGSYTIGRLLKDYHEGIVNVDMMVIEELSDLFFMLW